MIQAGAVDRAGFGPTLGSKLSRQDQQAAWAGADGGAAASGAGSAAGEHAGYRGQDGSGASGGGGGAANAELDHGVSAGGVADAAGETDLGWLSAEQLAAMGLARREDVVKSTSMVRETKPLGTDGDTGKGIMGAYGHLLDAPVGERRARAGAGGRGALPRTASALL